MVAGSRYGLAGLWEVGSILTGGKIARVIFAVETRTTPKRDLDLALDRKKEVANEKEKPRIVLR